MDDVDGKDDKSWNLQMEPSLFSFLRFLEGSYHLFLYPVDVDGMPDRNIHYLEIKRVFNIEDKDLKHRFGKINKYAVYLGVLFIAKLMACILIYGPSDISYIQLMFNNVQSSINLIKDITLFFKTIYIEEYNDNIEVNIDSLFTSYKDFIHLTRILNNYDFYKKYKEIQDIVMTTWCIVFSSTEKEYQKREFFTKPDDTKINYKTTTLDNNYYCNYYKSIFSEDYIGTIIFKSLFRSLKNKGFFIPNENIIDEMIEISINRNTISYMNVFNILKLKNINRSIVIYNDITFDNFKSFFDNDKKFKPYYHDNNKGDTFKLYDIFKIDKLKRSTLIKLDSYFNLYLLFEYIDYFLYITEFNEFTNQEVTDKSNFTTKLQYFTPLLEYYTLRYKQLKKYKLDPIEYKEFYNIGVYLCLLLNTCSPTYKHILNNNELGYIASESAFIEPFFEVLGMDINIFSNIGMTRKVGYHFELAIKYEQNGIEELFDNATEFVEKIMVNTKKIYSIS